MMDRMHGQRSHPSQPSSTDWAPRHDVRFYNEDRSLVATVTDFLAEGIQAGQPIIVLATAPHKRAIVARLKEQGLDPEQLPAEDSLWLDPHDTLRALMQGPLPNVAMFNAVAENVLDRVTAKRPNVIVRAYGEMVDLLWREGKSDGAIALENLWNHLANKYRLEMLCTYSKESLMAHSPDDGVERICAVHQRVL